VAVATSEENDYSSAHPVITSYRGDMGPEGFLAIGDVYSESDVLVALGIYLDVSIANSTSSSSDAGSPMQLA
jgi:hypothetical protein